MSDFQLIDGLRIKTNPAQASMWDGFEFGTPGKYVTYFDDFHTFTAADWTVTNAGGSTQALATAAPCVGGVLLTTLGNADNTNVSMQKLGHSFVPTEGTKIYFEARLQTSEATQMDWLVGLVITDTDPMTSYTEGISFRKDDGDTSIDFNTTIGSASSEETAIGTFAANTYVKVGFLITGTSQVDYWVNDVLQGTKTTHLPTAPLRVTAHFQDGDTGAALGALTASWDYVFVAQERPGY